jgi:hypothetical protein
MRDRATVIRHLARCPMAPRAFASVRFPTIRWRSPEIKQPHNQIPMPIQGLATGTGAEIRTGQELFPNGTMITDGNREIAPFRRPDIGSLGLQQVSYVTF